MEYVHIIKARNQKYKIVEKSIIENIKETKELVNIPKMINNVTSLEEVTYRIPNEIVTLYKTIEKTLTAWFPTAIKRYLNKKNVAFTSDRNFILLSIRRSYITIKLLEVATYSDHENRFDYVNKINDAPFTVKYNINNYDDFLYCKSAITDSYNKSIKEKQLA